MSRLSLIITDLFIIQNSHFTVGNKEARKSNYNVQAEMSKYYCIVYIALLATTSTATFSADYSNTFALVSAVESSRIGDCIYTAFINRSPSSGRGGTTLNRLICKTNKSIDECLQFCLILPKYEQKQIDPLKRMGDWPNPLLILPSSVLYRKEYPILCRHEEKISTNSMNLNKIFFLWQTLHDHSLQNTIVEIAISKSIIWVD